MEEQIKIIQDMLDKTRRNFADNGTYFIMWGWLILTACLGQYIFAYFNKSEWIGIMWITIMMGGGIVSSIMGLRQGRKKGVVTHADQTIGFLWMACGLSMTLIAFVGVPIGLIPMKALNPVIMMNVWIGVLVTGRIIDWKPLQWSALLWFAGAIICIMIHWHYHSLVMAILIIPGYIIPGYVLRKKFTSTVND
jgi:hypothetical protein